MRRRLFLAASAAALTLSLAFGSAAMAAQPSSPGCFGQDRAEWIHANGGSAWGAIAAERAGTNGDLNQAYKDSCGGSPSH